jgi:hypothetical protein
MVFKPPPIVSGLLRRLQKETAGAEPQGVQLEEKLLLLLDAITDITSAHRTRGCRPWPAPAACRCCPSAFARMVRRHVGVTPRETRSR